jgi:hypothetical protein
VNPAKIAECAKIAAEELFGANADLHAEFAEIWPSPWTDEHQRILDLIEKNA